MKSEKARLNAVAAMLNGDADALYAHLEAEGAAPYARATVFTRVGTFWDFVIARGEAQAPNPYKVFKREKARLFKNVYTPKKPRITFEEAKARIALLTHAEDRAQAILLLTGGLRFSESLTIRDGMVIGKGGKPRDVFVGNNQGSPYRRAYRSFLRALYSVGLKPHDLRKIFLTAFVEAGANMFELQEVAGWASLEPAKAYINVNRASIERKLALVHGGTDKNEAKQVSG
jgi:integrase